MEKRRVPIPERTPETMVIIRKQIVQALKVLSVEHDNVTIEMLSSFLVHKHQNAKEYSHSTLANNLRWLQAMGVVEPVAKMWNPRTKNYVRGWKFLQDEYEDYVCSNVLMHIPNQIVDRARVLSVKRKKPIHTQLLDWLKMGFSQDNQEDKR